MASSSSSSALNLQHHARPLAVSDAVPTQQQQSGASVLAAAALAATATLATAPKQGVRGGSAILQSLRRCASVATSTTGPCHAAAHHLAAPRHAASAAACVSGRCTGVTGSTASSATLWGQLRRQLRAPDGGRRLLGLPPLAPLWGRTVCTTAAASGGAATTAAAARGGVLAGRRGLMTAGGLHRSWGVRRMATQASGGAAGGAAAPAAGAHRGLLRGRVGTALRLQLAAAWQTYGAAAYVTAVLAAVVVLWRLMRSITNLFIAVNDRVAEYGIMALAASLVLLGVLYLRWRTAVNPSAVYRQTMMQLNTHPGVLEVMGAPLVGSPVRAYVVTGGGLYLSKKFRIKLRSRRIQMMFPLSGSDRKGLVSLEAKRKHGRYEWKLLAVDLGPELQAALPAGGSTGLSAAPPRPVTAAPPPPDQQRVYVVGDLATYQRGGVLGELRAPFLKALSNSRSYEVEDELEDELDELEVPKASSGGGALAKAAGSAVRSALASAAAALKPAPKVDGAAEGKSSPAAPVAAAAAEGSTAPGTEKAASKPAPAAAAAAAPKASPSPPPPAASGPSSGAQEGGPQDGAAAAAEEGTSGSWWGRLRSLLSGPGAAK